MARGAKTLSARPPPQAWLANCLDPTARVVTVSAKELGLMIEAREAKIPKSAPSRATAKRGRGEGSGAKYTVTEQEGYVWVKCDECSKRRYAPGAKAEKSKPDAKWKCEDMRDDSRPDVSCATPEDAFPRANYSVEGVPAPPPGWRREVIPRKTVSGADAYYYSPCGKRMRSKPDVQRFLDKSKEQGKYLDVNIESFDFATGDRRGVPAKAPGASGSDATKTDAEAKDPNRKPAKRAKKEEPAAKTAEPAPEGEPAKRGRGRPRRAEKAEGKKEEGDDEERAAAETADA